MGGKIGGKQAYRASIFHVLDDPRYNKDAYEFLEDGILVVENGKVSALGHKETGSVLCPNPPSNMFLGSGLFKFQKAKDFGVKVALGTDFGAGNTFSMLRSMEEAYKTAQLQGYSLSPFEAFYLTTLGGARALAMDDKLGNFEFGKEADFVVLDKQSTPFLAWRMDHAKPPLEILFVLMMLGDDRAVKATYVYGNKLHDRDAPSSN
jgi:guanine deaminase